MLARLSLLAMILILDVVVIHAQWSTDPMTSTVISNANGDLRPQVLTKVKGGNIVMAWSIANAANGGLYAQGVDSTGVVLWKNNGVHVCTLNSSQEPNSVVPDNAGGAFIFWSDSRAKTSDIYMQRLDKYGLPLFAKNGIPVFDSAANRGFFHTLPDGSGGTLIYWVEYSGAVCSIRAQHLDADGKTHWAEPTVVAKRDRSSLLNLKGIVDDGKGGMIVYWSETLPNNDHAFYTQRIDSTGRIRWNPKSVAICDLNVGYIWSSESIRVVRMTKDGASGAYFAIHDIRLGRKAIFLQHVDSAGNPKLEKCGRLISDTSFACTLGEVVTSGIGKLFVAWWFRPNPTVAKNRQVLQLYGEDGLGHWPEPVGIPPDSVGTTVPEIISDQNGGVIAIWEQVQGSAAKIYAQRFNSVGSRRWGEEGRFFAAIQQNAQYYYFTPAIISDGSHGAVVAYTDVSASQRKELRIQQINEDGVLGVLRNPSPPPVDSDSTESPIVGIRSISPNPSNGILDLEFVVPVRGTFTVTVYNAIGEVVAVPFQEFVQRDIATTVSINLSAQSSGAFFCRLTGPYINESKMFIVQH